MIEDRRALLLSAAEPLIRAGRVDQATVDQAAAEINTVQRDPNAVIMDAFMQAHAEVIA